MKPSERSLEGVMAELKALRQAYGAAQRRCTATLQRLHARNQALEAEVLQLRAQLAALDPSMAMAAEAQRRMLAAARGAQAGRGTLGARIESLAQRLQSLLRGAPDADARALPDAVQGLSPSTPSGVGEGVPAVAAHAAGGAPAAGSEALSPEAVASTLRAVRPLHLTAEGLGSDVTDDFQDPPDLEERLVEADLVICQTGCLSHQAYWRVQDHCRRHNKPCVLVAQPDALRIIRIHQRDDAAKAGAVPAEGAPATALEAAAGVPDGRAAHGRTGADGSGTGSEARTRGHQQESGIT